MKLFFTLTTFLYCLFFISFHSLAQENRDDLDDKNFGSQSYIIEQQLSSPFSNSYRTPPPAPTVSGDNLCGPSTASLSATASAGGTLNWYSVATGGTSLGTGSNYNPVVTGTTNFWVDETVGGAAGGGTTMATPYNSNNGQRGCMFDITATNTITITSFDANLYAGTTGNYEIYYRTGTHVGNENNSAAWTLLGSATAVTSLGNNLPTPLPIPFSVTIPAGQTHSFYVTNDFGAGTSYTDGTAVGNFLASDANLTIYEGVGKSYPFGLTFNVRNFNGTIHYNTGGGSETGPRSMVTATVKTPAYAPTATTTVSNATCTVNESGIDWTYYYNSANPDNLLFAIAHDPNNLGNNSFTATANIVVRNNSTTNCYMQDNPPQQLARFVMGRYWNVNLLSGNIVDPVWIRFYYQPAERTAMNSQASNWIGTNGGTQSPMYFFKTLGAPFSPTSSLHYEGVYNSIELINLTDNQTASNGTNYVEIHDISSFSGGGLITGVVPNGGSTTSSAILLETKLLSFSATTENNQTRLNWVSSQEHFTSHYTIEHSLDGIQFHPITTIDANNETSDENSYHEWLDRNPSLANNYYRLKIVSITGEVHYSEIRVVSFKENGLADIYIYPNPFKETLNINVQSSHQQEVSILVLNALGQEVYYQKKSVNQGISQLRINNTQQWESGCYVVVLKSKSFSKQVVVVKP